MLRHRALVVSMVQTVHSVRLCWWHGCVCLLLQVIRRMLRSRESFDIDNANLRAREAQLIARFGEHVTATAARFHAEAEDRYNNSNALREALGAWVRGRMLGGRVSWMLWCKRLAVAASTSAILRCCDGVCFSPVAGVRPSL